jgi:CheY-like chemotaxis protein
MTVVLDLLRPILGGGIKVEEDYCDPPCFVLADASQFETAIVNLAVNARDAMEGGGTLSFAVEATSEIPATRGHEIIPGHFIRISVTDTGSGIESDTLANIFDPFFTTKEVGKGTGLGLSQAFGFAKQSKGDIDVSSEAGIGSTFSLYLPQCRMSGTPFVHSEHRLDDASVPSVEDERVSGPRILIVEDNENVGQLAVEMLQELGYHTTYALNASLALKQLADSPEPFDLVFSDVMMPGMNGIELGEEIRRSNPSLPVILTSGYSDVLAQEGSHGFKLIAKPYSISALAKVLDMVLSNDREPNS